MSDGIATLLTPVPVPRAEKNEIRLSGCAAAFQNQDKSHLFLDEHNRKGHDLCKIRKKLYGHNFEDCAPKKLNGERYWDFRDKHDHRKNPKESPFLTIRNFLFDKINFSPEIRDNVLFRDDDDFDKMLTALAVCPELRHDFYGDYASYFPSKAVEGFLRTRFLTKDKNNDKSSFALFDEGVVLNQSTLLT